MQRLGEALAELAEVPVDPEGDLLVRVRRGPGRPGTWQVLIRTTPRPLATRAWRTVNYPGADRAAARSSSFANSCWLVACSPWSVPQGGLVTIRVKPPSSGSVSTSPLTHSMRPRRAP